MELQVLQPARTLYESHHDYWHGCTKCAIGNIAQNHVFGRGMVPCEILFIGEAPGKMEDKKGAPFVGRSGELLDEWIFECLRISPNPDYVRVPIWAITNTVLCRPTDRIGGPNRPPELQEMTNCKPRLDEFVLKVAKPKAIITVGKYADLACRRIEILRWAIPHPAWVLRMGGSGSLADQNVRAKLHQIIKEIYEDGQTSRKAKAAS